MRLLCGACLVTASIAGLATTSSAVNAKEAKRLLTATFDIVLVTQSDGTLSIEALEPKLARARQKKLDKDYAAQVKFWKESLVFFRKDPENRGRRFRQAPPIKPSIKVMQKRVKGKVLADAMLKRWNDNWLKPILAKREKRAAKKAGLTLREEPRGKPESLPEGNQVMNGGFEKQRSKDVLADGWAKGQWGGTRKKFSVRRSKMNPREGGEYSMVLYALEEGAGPGVSTTVKLPLAKYDIRFWACADVGKTAEMQTSFDGNDLPSHDIGDEWQQYKNVFTVEKKNPMAKLRIWTTTNRVRVYLDDVEIEVFQLKPKKPDTKAGKGGKAGK